MAAAPAPLAPLVPLAPIVQPGPLPLMEEARARPTHRYYVVATAETEPEHLSAAANGAGAGSLLGDAPLPRRAVEHLLSQLFGAVPAGTVLDTGRLQGSNPLGYLLSLAPAHPAQAGETPANQAARLQREAWPAAWKGEADATFGRHRGFARDERGADISGDGYFRWQVKRTRLQPTRRTDKATPIAKLTKKQAILRLGELWRLVCNLPRQLREMLVPMARWQGWPAMAAEMPEFTRGGLRYVELAPDEPERHKTPWPDGYARLPPDFFTRGALWDARWRLESTGHVAPSAAAGIDAHTCYFVFKFRPQLAAVLQGELAQQQVQQQQQVPAPLVMPDQVATLLNLAQLVPGGGGGGGGLHGGYSEDADLLGGAGRGGRGGRGGGRGGAHGRGGHGGHGVGHGNADLALAFRRAAVGETAPSLDATLLPTETRVARMVRRGANGNGNGGPAAATQEWRQHAAFGRPMWDVVPAGADAAATGVQVTCQAATLRLLTNGAALYTHALATAGARPAGHPLRRLLDHWRTDVTFLRALQGVFLSHRCVVVPFQELAREYADEPAVRARWVNHIARSCRAPGEEHNRVVSEADAELLADADSWLYRPEETEADVAGAFDCAYAIVDWSRADFRPVVRGYIWCRNGTRHPILGAYALHAVGADLEPAPVERAETVSALPRVHAAAAALDTSPASLHNNLYVEQLCASTGAVDGTAALPGGLGLVLMLYALAARSTAAYHGVSLEVVWAPRAETAEGGTLGDWPRGPDGRRLRAILPDPRVLALYHELLGFQRAFYMDADTSRDIAAHWAGAGAGAGGEAEVRDILSVFAVDGAPPYERVFDHPVPPHAREMLADYNRLLVPPSQATAALASGDPLMRDKSLRAYPMYRPYPLPGALVRIMELVVERHGERLGAALQAPTFAVEAVLVGGAVDINLGGDSDSDSDADADSGAGEADAGIALDDEEVLGGGAIAESVSSASSASSASAAESAVPSVASASLVSSAVPSAAPPASLVSSAVSSAASPASVVSSAVPSAAPPASVVSSAVPPASVASSAAPSVAPSLPSVPSASAASVAASIAPASSSLTALEAAAASNTTAARKLLAGGGPVDPFLQALQDEDVRLDEDDEEGDSSDGESNDDADDDFIGIGDDGEDEVTTCSTCGTQVTVCSTCVGDAGDDNHPPNTGGKDKGKAKKRKDTGVSITWWSGKA